jgi:hypothetical protein
MRSFTAISLCASFLCQPLLAEQKWFEKMEIGPAWMDTFGDYSHGEKRVGALKGLSLDLGDGWRALYDTETLRLSSVYQGGVKWGGTSWTGQHGSFVTLNNQDGLLATAVGSGWADEKGSFADNRPLKGYGDILHGEFLGHYRHGREIVLEYVVNGTEIMENISQDGVSATRSFKFGPRKASLTLLVADEEGVFTVNGDSDSARAVDGLDVSASEGLKLTTDPKKPGRLLAEIPAGEGEFIAQVSFSKAKPPEFGKKPDFAKLVSGGPAIWPEIITTEGKVSENDNDSYVTDIVTLPEDNPWHSNLRFGGFDFIDEDSAALSTWNGDVWVVRGLSGDWKELKWQRIAAGLFQTLGLKVVDGEIYVNGRDQITKLIDLNGDGETDHFKVFNRDVYITENFHEFAFDLQTDKAGNFYFAKGGPVRRGGRGFEKIVPHHGIVAKISPDGEKFEVVATGLRAPGGLGIGPEGQITTGENEGTWQPVCKINLVSAGETPVFFGTEDTRQGLSDAPYTEPLVYLPMDVDNSGGSQVWVPDFAKFGLKTGELLHLSYGKSSILRVLPVVHNGKLQGGVVKLPIKLQSSAMRARFHPDGSMYVLGFRGWQTNAAKPSAFQRIRFNEDVGLNVPEKLEYTERGVKITFPVKLDSELVEDTTSYSVQRWDYVRGPQYGSGEFSVDQPDEEARKKALESESKKQRKRDDVEVQEARLLEDGKTVELVIEGMKPSMSLKVGYDLEDLDGEVLNSEIHATVYGE